MKKIISTLAIGVLTLFANDKVIEVYESPTCGCCELWADYMKTKGYEVRVHKTEDFLKIKEEYKIKDIYIKVVTQVL